MTSRTQTLALCMWIVAGMSLTTVMAMRLTIGRQGPPPVQTASSSATVLNGSEDLPVLYPAPQFTLTDQHNQTFSNAQLLGHPWVADFVFTTCANLCPVMSSRMAGLQDRLPADVKLVSFSVDPVHDTPAVLSTYASQYHAQDGRWVFLTGSLKDISGVVSGMKTYFEPASGTNPIMHSPYFVLVDASGSIRRYYDSNDTEQTDELVRDVNRLLGASGK